MNTLFKSCSIILKDFISSLTFHMCKDKELESKIFQVYTLKKWILCKVYPSLLVLLRLFGWQSNLPPTENLTKDITTAFSEAYAMQADFDPFCSFPFMPCTEILGSDLQDMASVSRLFKTRGLGGGDEFRRLFQDLHLLSRQLDITDHPGDAQRCSGWAFGGFINMPRLFFFFLEISLDLELSSWRCGWET